MSALGKKQRRMPPPQSAFSGIVRRRVVSVSSRIVHIMRRLYGEGAVAAETVMDGCTDRSELVATFLALLELIKSGRIAIDDDVVRLTGRAADGLDELEISSETDAPEADNEPDVITESLQ